MNTSQLSNPAAGASAAIEGLELVSALADGQLGTQDCERAVRLALDDTSAAGAWSRYHLIGDVLRSPDLALPLAAEVDRPAFVSAVMRRVAAEPILHVQQPELRVVRMHATAANDAWGWKLVAGFASVAAVAAIAWNFIAVPDSAGVQAAASAVVAPIAVTSQEPVMIRDARLDELLAAHKQFGGNSVLQAPAGVLRNATFEVPSR